MVVYIEFQGCSFNNVGELSMVYMADPLKKVMLDMKVQSTKEKTNYWIAPGKICRGTQLMNRP